MTIIKLKGNPLDSLEASCDNEKKAELSQAFVECANKGIMDLIEELKRDRNKKPWETDYCIKYEEAVSILQ